MPIDRVYETFLERQYVAGLALAVASDLLQLVPMTRDGRTDLPTRYLARFTCRGLVTGPAGEVQVADDFAVGIVFPADYLRRVTPGEVVTWLAPRGAFHPNVLAKMHLICLGRLPAGTPLVDILGQCHAMISWQHFNLRDPLDLEACAWARVEANRARLPIDGRPLRWRQGSTSGGPA